MASRDMLLEAIGREQARLAGLDSEREVVSARLQALRAELNSLVAEPLPPYSLSHLPSKTLPATPSEKIALFRSLFRGRDDVFARMWTSRRTGRTGYSPVRRGDWQERFRGKNRLSESKLPNEAFVPLTDQVLLDHLQGRHVIGMYPLLTDETCCFLAVDFDKQSWMEDVAAFINTCQRADIAAAVERSRSGNGAHVWFFFTAPVTASAARKMGCYLLTETMARRHELSMKSYDRLFPNQDTLPRGGFGNLIALPLQHGPRQEGNTVFLNNQLVPHGDQWAYLASLKRLEPGTVEAVAREASREGQVIGVRMSEMSDEEASPWTRLPSRRKRQAHLTEPLPKTVSSVLVQRLFVEKAGLPSALLNQIKRLAAFQNPEFYKKQSMRLSTAITPRVIACAEELPNHIALPRGCLEDLRDLLREYYVALKVEDRREEGETLELRFTGSLTPLQERAAAAMLKHDFGVMVAPPGVGKTVVGAYLIAARARNTLVLVHRKPLLEQWAAQLSLFLGVEPRAIGQIGGGKHKPNGRLDLAMLQSLGRKGQVDDLVAGYGHVLIDECHHLPAVFFERVLAEVRARYVTGLTATPYRRDGHQPIIHMQCGPVRFSVSSRSHDARRPFLQNLVCRETRFQAAGLDGSAGIQEIYAAIAADEDRNQLILDDLVAALKEGRSPILLMERRDHVKYFAARLRGVVRHLVVRQGGMTPKERRKAQGELADIPNSAERLVLATGRYIGEGFDDARLDTLFLAMPVSWRGTLVQYTGRLHRPHPGKTEVRIYDYVDREVPMLRRMFEKRLRGYRAIGYLLDKIPSGEEALDRKPVI